MRTLGVGVVGAGRAGRARARALHEHAHAHLVRSVSGRDTGEVAALLADSAVDAVIVCTPNLLHARAVQAALEAGHHVLVEFPIAASAEEARELFAHAHEVKRVLHVEHVELLSAGQRAQRERAATLGSPCGGELEFRGGLDGWIADRSLAGSEALRAVARLHRLADLFGPARVRAARLASHDGYRLEVDVGFERGGHTRLIEERRASLGRALRWNVPCEHGLLDDPPGSPPPGPVFLEDLDAFVERVRSGAPGYVPDERVLHVLERVGEIESLLG